MSEKSNKIPDWENSNIISIGKEPAHSTLIPFKSLDKALGKWEDSLYYKSLNGDWKFHWVRRPEDRPRDFYKIEFVTKTAYYAGKVIIRTNTVGTGTHGIAIINRVVNI